MTAQVHVVVKADHEVVGQFMFEAQVGLLRICVLEILGYREAERLHGERHAIGQIVLLDEHGIGFECIEALLIL